MMTNRKRGCLIGLAVGDALGAVVEFRYPGTFPPVTCYRSGGPHSLAAGQWTDDTSLALALADSMKNGWDLDAQAKNYCDWMEEGKFAVNGWCFDIGGTTKSALQNYLAGVPILECADPTAAASGNGSIMRLAPVPIFFHYLYHTDIHRLAQYGEESSLVTHASKQCLSACRYMTVILAALIDGVEREEALSPDFPKLQKIHEKNPLHPLIWEVAQGSFRRKNKMIKGSGWVVESLEAALWAFHDAKSFEEAVLKAVNLGDDADTTGAVCGQFAGAYWGETGIPYSLRAGLDKMNMLEDALKSLGV